MPRSCLCFMSMLFAIIQSFDHSAIELLQPLQPWQPYSQCSNGDVSVTLILHALCPCYIHVYAFCNHSIIESFESFESFESLQPWRYLSYAYTSCLYFLQSFDYSVIQLYSYAAIAAIAVIAIIAVIESCGEVSACLCPCSCPCPCPLQSFNHAAMQP